MNEQEVRDGLNRFVESRKSTITFAAKVKSVDEVKRTIVVEDNEDFEYVNVRLQATQAIDKGILQLPEIGSWVLVSNIGKSENALYVVAFSEVQKWIAEIDQTTISMDSQGIEMKVGLVDIKSLFLDLLTGIELLTVGTPAGPSTVPVNLATFTQLKAKVNSLFK